MRREVLDLMAEEIAMRPVDPLASFRSFDKDGRARLDGMARGKRWDLEHEQVKWEKANSKELRKLYLRRWYQKNADHCCAINRRRYAANRERLCACARERYRAHLETNRAAKRRASKRWYESGRAYKPKGVRRCSVCRRGGHNRMRCPEST